MKNINKYTTPDELGQYILSERDRLASQRTIGGIEFMHAYSDVVDSVICRIFELSVDCVMNESDNTAGFMRKNVSLIATGGYGRREMSPLSDIDVTFIVDDEDDPLVDILVKRTYRLLMDVLLNGAGLKVGYAYRIVGDNEELPLETQTALLDSRYIIGSVQLYDRFYSSILRSITPGAFITQHIDMRKKITAEWGGSAYRVEPNVKEGSGGLRDLQTARWMAQITFNVPGENVWHALRSRGIISDQELQWVDGATEFLAKIRNALHYTGKRGGDILSIERQNELATSKRFTINITSLMSRHYLHAERIAAIYRKVSSTCLDQALEIEPGIVVQGGEILVPDKGLLSRDPAAFIRIFEHMITYRATIAWETVSLLREYSAARNGKRTLHAGRAGGAPWLTTQAFLRLLALPTASIALDAMVKIGALQWLIPEFARIMHLIPGDAAHEYTVGAHSLEVTRQLGTFINGSEDELKEISHSIQEPELLCLAALMHDAGKIDDGGNHSEKGAELAGVVARRLGLRSDAASKVEFLIRNHLVMSETARLRDLNETRTMQEFITVVDNQERLDMLYLLTIADLRSVGQSVWSEVQVRFLRELYHRATTVLRGSVGAPFDMERHRGRLARELSLANLPKEEIDEHCNSIPASYLLNTPPDDLAAHIVYVRSARNGKPVVRLKDDITGRFTVITICAMDDPTPGLLSKITGVVAASGVDIHAAQVFTRESYDRIAIDHLYVDFDHRNLPELRRLQLQSELEDVISGKTDLASHLKKYCRNMQDEVIIQNLKIISHLSEQHTIVEIETVDQPGLLFKLTRAISMVGWNIHSARVSTWGSKARDAFYVTDKDGCKLDTDALGKLRKAISSLHTSTISC
ncbi:MAG: [protein-PII] uridylyltransferase family protein [Armatimonadota bacterium]